MAKIGSPLFILREECAKDLMSVLERIAAIGYEGVEFLGFFGHSPQNIRKKLDSLGLCAIGDHVSYGDFARDTDRVIAEHSEAGCGYITIGNPFSADAKNLPGQENYTKVIETMERIGAAMNVSGMKLLYHNHKEEAAMSANGKSILENLMDDTDSALLSLEPDLGWLQIGGADPAYYLKKYIDRSPVLHFKDFIPAASDNAAGFMFRPTGYGIVNNAQLYALSLTADTKTDWLIMDHDNAYDRNSFDDLQLSLQFFRNLIMIQEKDEAM